MGDEKVSKVIGKLKQPGCWAVPLFNVHNELMGMGYYRLFK